MFTSVLGISPPKCMFYDCHVHTRYSGHSKDYSLMQAGKIAEGKGIVLSVREHAPFPKEFFDSSRKNHYVNVGGLPPEKASLQPESMERFFNEIRESGLSLGFEVDILPGFEKETEGIIKKLEHIANEKGVQIDGINGSHHYHNGKVWDSSYELLCKAIKTSGGFKRFINSYFGQIRDAMRTGLYDTISHLELPLKFIGNGNPLEKKLDSSKQFYAEEIEKTFETAKKQDIAIEYNTSGFDYACKSACLGGYSLHFACHMNVPIVIGSDTHALEHIGRHFDFAALQLKEYGIKKLHYFKNRERVSYNI